MIILDLPNWIVYVSWFVFVNLAIVFILILWLVLLNKRDMRREQQYLESKVDGYIERQSRPWK